MKNILRVKNNISHWFLALLIAALSWNSARAQDYSDYFSNNGSFEFGSNSPPLLFSGSNTSSVVTGWLLFGSNGQNPQWYDDANAQEGNRYISLRSNGGAGAGSSSATIDGYQISHTPFDIGQLYELSFWAAGGPAQNNFIRAAIGTGTSLLQTDIDVTDYTSAEFGALNGLEWNRYTIPFTATDSTIYMSVASPQSTAGGYQSVVYLDNFSIVAVPEPSGVLLVLTAGFVLGTRRRRMDLSHV
jgi:hypothetical protein